MRKYYIFFFISIPFFSHALSFADSNDTLKQVEQSMRDSKMDIEQMRVDSKLDRMNLQINNKIDNMNNQFRLENEKRSLDQSQTDSQNYSLQTQKDLTLIQSQIDADRVNQNLNTITNVSQETKKQNILQRIEQEGGYISKKDAKDKESSKSSDKEKKE